MSLDVFVSIIATIASLLWLDNAISHLNDYIEGAREYHLYNSKEIRCSALYLLIRLSILKDVKIKKMKFLVDSLTYYGEECPRKWSKYKVSSVFSLDNPHEFEYLKEMVSE